MVHSISSESVVDLAYLISSVVLPVTFFPLFTCHQHQQQCRWKDSLWRLPSAVKRRHNMGLELLFIRKNVEQTQTKIPSNLQEVLWSVRDEIRTVIFGLKSLFLCRVVMSSLQSYHHYVRTVGLKTQFCISICWFSKSLLASRAGAPLPAGT